MDMCICMCIVKCIDMCIDMCIGMCIDMGAVKCVGMFLTSETDQPTGWPNTETTSLKCAHPPRQ